jgi:hypothetical protein
MVSFTLILFRSCCLSMCYMPFEDPQLKNNAKSTMIYFDFFLVEDGMTITNRRSRLKFFNSDSDTFHGPLCSGIDH